MARASGSSPPPPYPAAGGPGAAIDAVAGVPYGGGGGGGDCQCAEDTPVYAAGGTYGVPHHITSRVVAATPRSRSTTSRALGP
jgi:hypothetical protein